MDVISELSLGCDSVESIIISEVVIKFKSVDLSKFFVESVVNDEENSFRISFADSLESLINSVLS